MRARPVYPGDVHMITRRVNAFLCRLRPGEDVRHVVVYCLARAARRHGIEVIAFTVMSTHLLCAAAHNRCYAELDVMRSGLADR